MTRSTTGPVRQAITPRSTCGCTSPGWASYDQHTRCRSSSAARAAYIWDTNGKRYLDALSGLFVVQVGHGREELAAGRRRAGPQAGVLPDLVLRPPHRDRAGRPARGRGARRPEQGVLLLRRRRVGRDRLEGGQAVLQADRKAEQVQGDQPGHRLPRHHPGRVVDHRRAAVQAGLRAAGPGLGPGARTPTSTGRRRSSPTTRRRSAGGPPTRSRRPS